MARRVVRLGPRRLMEWVGIDISPQTMTGAVLLAIANDALLALRSFTIVRTRMRFLITSDQGASTEITIGAFGVIILQEEAVDAGIASLPTPGVEVNAPWFVFEPFVHEFQFDSAVGSQSPGGTLTTVDSKAMRKVGVSEDIAFIGQTVSTDGAIISGFGRMLLKLH